MISIAKDQTKIALYPGREQQVEKAERALRNKEWLMCVQNETLEQCSEPFQEHGQHILHTQDAKLHAWGPTFILMNMGLREEMKPFLTPSSLLSLC